MSRFSSSQLELLYTGRVRVRTHSRPTYLRVPQKNLFTFQGNFQEKDINKLINAKKLIKLPPFTYVTCVEEETRFLLEKFGKGSLRFVYVKARVDGMTVAGLMPKGVLHDYAYGVFHSTYTGITYGGYKTAFSDSHQIVNFKETGRCKFCDSPPSDHKLYETEDALLYARRLLHALYDNRWAGQSAHMLGVLYAFNYNDFQRYVYAAYSGELTTHDFTFQLVLEVLNGEEKSSGRTWRFARTLTTNDPHLIWDGTDTIGMIKNLPGNSSFTMQQLRCAAPKLIQAAHRDSCIPIAMSEIWYYGGDYINKTDFLYACTAESCNLCRMSIPPMLCGRDAKSVDEEVHQVF